MSCPKKIKVAPAEISRKKCRENYKFWLDKIPNDVSEEAIFTAITDWSKKILPCHTTAYENLKKIFSYDESTQKFDPKSKGILCHRERKKATASVSGEDEAPHMKDSLSIGHDIFLFAYHGVHNPYHRQEDEIPVKPFGFFLKKDIETFSCVHGSPCDITTKNELVNGYRDEHIDKYYLLPEDLRTLKPSEILTDSYLKKDFWYYYGNPQDWRKQKGYGNALYKRAGEFRYFGSISPDKIAAVLWPVWEDNNEVKVNNIDLYYKFREAYPGIDRIQYNPYKQPNNWALSLVEASYYSQRYFLEFNKFPDDSNIAQKIIDKKYGTPDNARN